MAGELLAWRSVLTTKVLAVGLVLAVLWRLRTERPARLPAAGLAWFGLALIVTASLFWTVDPAATLRIARHLAQEGTLFVALALCPQRERLLRALALGAGAGAAILGLGYGLALGLGEPRGGRLVLVGGDPNHQGRAMALGALLLLGLGGRRALAAAGVAALGVGLSGSRGTWLALGLALLCFSSRERAALGVLACIGLGALLLGLQPGLRSALPMQDREAVSSGRDAIWLNTLDVVRDHPVLGVGAGGVPAVYDSYRDARMERGGLHSKRGRDPHSLYLQLLAELGPLGLLAFLVALGLVVRDLARAPREDRLRAGSVLLFAAVGAATVGPLEQKAFWLALFWAALAAPAAQPVSSRTSSSRGASATVG